VEELLEGGDAFSVAAEGFGGGDGSVLLAVLGDGDVVGHFDSEVYHGGGGGGGEVGFGVAPLPRAEAASVPAGRRRFRIRQGEAMESGRRRWWRAGEATESRLWQGSATESDMGSWRLWIRRGEATELGRGRWWQIWVEGGGFQFQHRSAATSCGSC